MADEKFRSDGRHKHAGQGVKVSSRVTARKEPETGNVKAPPWNLKRRASAGGAKSLE